MAQSKRSAEKESFWRLVLEEYQRSGLAVRAFCQREGLSEPSFYAWRREIRQRDGKPPAAGECEQQTLIPVDLVELVTESLSPGEVAPRSALEVITPSGFTLRFPAEIEPQQLRALLAAIADCQSGGGPC